MAYPTTLDDATVLYEAVNNLFTTLSASYTSPANTLTLADNSAFPSTGGFIYVGGERGTYTGKSGATLTGVTGLSNNYSAGITVEMFIDAGHHNALRTAIQALEAKLGINSSADVNSVDYKLAQKPALSGNVAVALGAAAAGVAGDASRQDHVHPTTGLELTANKATGFGTVNDTLYPSVQAVKTYADGLVVGLLDDRGNYNASGNVWPSSGGSGTAGAILKGDLWTISVAGTLGSVAVVAGDTIRALVDTPGSTASNWAIMEAAGAYITPTSTDILTNKTLTSAKETRTAPTISAATLTLDLSLSSIFDVSLNAAITTLTISNPAASGTSHGFVLTFTADGTPRAVTWPASIKWPSATAPTLTSTNAKKDKFVFHTTDGGTTYHAFIVGQNL